ncbi:MAG: nucleotidyltransferase domain-containing protein, partial [Dehalococcoidia bacterium]|nr:nucleotidyltransferase domain-containing protein [Dehalococcoidia bacterium]
MKVGKLEIAESSLRTFCQKWRITEFAVFGSVLRDDFGPESDVDVLVTFE